VGKLRLCLPMMILLVLAGCGRLPVSPAEQQALQARGKYLEMTIWSARAQITADYGQRVYTFSVTASGDAEQTLLVLTAPETVAGMATRMGAEGTVLEYDGVQMNTGALPDGKTVPMQAIPKLLQAMRSGYIRSCQMQDGSVLFIRCGDPEQGPGSGEEISLWVDAQDFSLLRGEIFMDGYCAIRCEMAEFAMME